MKQRLKMPSTVPRRSRQSPARLSASHSYRQGFPDGTPSADTCKKSGDVPRCDRAAGVLGRESWVSRSGAPSWAQRTFQQERARMVTSGMPSFPSAEGRAALHIHIKHSLPQQPHPSQSHQSPLPTAGAGAPPASSGWSSCPGRGTNSLPGVYPGIHIPQ